jgi:cell division protein FtsL
MISIITLIVVSIFVMYMQNRKYNEDKNRITELENKLKEYYIQREHRINKGIRGIEVHTNRLRNEAIHRI